MSPQQSSFVFSVIAGLVAAVILSIARYWIGKFIGSRRKKAIAAYVLLLALLGSSAIVIWYIGRSWLQATPLSAAQFRWAFCAFLAQLVLGYLLFRLGRQPGNDVQHHGERRVKTRDGATGRRAITVRQLRPEGPDPDATLRLNWTTFSAGSKYLLKQIRDYSPRIEPDLCLGINPSGLAIASFLSGTYGRGTRAPIPLGYVHVTGHDHQVVPDEVSLPPQRLRVQTVLIADVEIKRGRSMRNVQEFLRERYGQDIDIKAAVLVVSEVREPLDHVEELAQRRKGVFEVDSQYLPDFVAYASARRVRSPYDV